MSALKSMRRKKKNDKNEYMNHLRWEKDEARSPRANGQGCIMFLKEMQSKIILNALYEQPAKEVEIYSTRNINLSLDRILANYELPRR